MGWFSCHQRVFAAFYQRRFVSRLKDTKRRGGVKRGEKVKKKGKEKKGGRGNVLVSLFHSRTLLFRVSRACPYASTDGREKGRRGNVYRIKLSLCLDNSAVHATIKRICFAANDRFNVSRNKRKKIVIIIIIITTTTIIIIISVKLEFPSLMIRKNHRGIIRDFVRSHRLIDALKESRSKIFASIGSLFLRR